MSEETEKQLGFVLRMFGTRRIQSELKMTLANYTDYATKLMMKVLPQPDPAPLDLRLIILAMGTALEIQMAKDPKIDGKRLGVCTVMKLIGINKQDVERYESLHCYYTAERHWNEVKHKERQSILSGKRGKEITAMFYESVRKILVAYYPNLLPIDFQKEGVRLDWEDRSQACP